VRTAVLREPLVRRLCGANLLFSLAVTQLETLFAFFMLARFGWDAREVAFVLVGMAVLMGGVQGGGMKRLAAHFGERALVVGGCTLLAAGFALLPLAPSVGVLLLPLGLAAVGRAVAQPSLMSLTSLAARPESRGAVMGAFQGAASLARVVGPAAAGWLFDHAISAPFWLAAALALAVALSARGLPQAGAGGEAG
jgi:MFS family permease